MARGVRGRGRGARGGRGRGRGRGIAAESVDTSVDQEATQEQVAEQQTDQGSGSAGVAGSAQGPGGGAGAADAPGRDDLLVGLLQQILERLPVGAPVQGQAPVVQPVGVEVQPGVAVAAVGELPSYLRMLEQMQRIGTVFYAGGVKPEEADLWRSRLERNFQSLRCPEEYKVDLAVHYLDGDAHLWWRGVASRRAQEAMSWVDFLAEFNAKYFPQEAMDRLEARFLELAQGDRSVREYDEEFGRLLAHAGRGFESEEAQVRRFMRGLRAELRTRCRASRFASRAELADTAAAIDEDLRAEQTVVVSPPVQQQQRKPQQQMASSRGSKPAQGQKRKWEGTFSSGQRQRGGCFECGSTDHRVASCPKKNAPSTPSVPSAPRVCYHCGETGHIKPRCPKLQMAVAVMQPVPEKAMEVQPLQQLAAPRVYTSVEPGEGSGARPITGTSCSSIPNL